MTTPGEQRLCATPFRKRLLAEALRLDEATRDHTIDDRNAVQHAIESTPPDLEARIIARALAHDQAKPLNATVMRATAALKWITLASVIIGFLLGVVAARSALANETASVFALLFGLIGVQSVLLLGWLVATVLTRRVGQAGLLGRMILTSWSWIVSRFGKTHHEYAATQAVATSLLTPPLARWLIATLTHTLWTAANLGMLAGLALLFIGEGYRFRWDSTWLRPDAYAQLIETVAYAPHALGFSLPDGDAIAASRVPLDSDTPAQSEEIRRTWSWFFFGAVVTYGLIPRALLSALSASLLLVSIGQYRLNLDRPGFFRLKRRLLPETGSVTTLVDAEHVQANTTHPGHDNPTRDDRPTGPPVVTGIEVEPPASGWPPPSTVTLTDLGMIDGRDDQHRVIDHLTGEPHRPARIIVICDLPSSPDRGMERILRFFVGASRGSCSLILTGGERLRTRADHDALTRRIRDWRNLAQRAGLETQHVHELDLDHLTSTTRKRFNAIAAGEHVNPDNAITTRNIEHAFDAIADAASDWPHMVTLKAQLPVHRAIAGVYEHRCESWLASLRNGIDKESIATLMRNPQEAPALLRDASMRVLDVLPDELKRRTGWAAAGALAGALGCVAGATFLMPAAIAALPSWSLIGGAVAAAIPRLNADPPKNAHPDGADAAEHASPDATSFHDALRAAILFTILLELQGAPETTITRVLGAFHSNDPTANATPQTIHRTLNRARQRFDLAMTRNQTP